MELVVDLLGCWFAAILCAEYLPRRESPRHWGPGVICGALSLAFGIRVVVDLARVTGVDLLWVTVWGERVGILYRFVVVASMGVVIVACKVVVVPWRRQ